MSLISQESLNQGEDDKLTLTDINLKIKKGTLVGIVGKIGSGKSSLLDALVGELEARKGTEVHMEGRVAYVAQKSWTLSTTI